MNDDLRKAIFEHVIDLTEGGTSTGITQMLDEAIDNGYISQAEFHDNESDILGLIDDHIFECVRCGWTLPISEESENEHDEMICRDCDEPE